MDNLDDSENNAKISDSAYSNSCSNSQSRRSHSSKSTHSGSNSSGSSGYGGKPSTSGSSNNLGQSAKKEKESKKKKQPQSESLVPAADVQAEIGPPETTTVFVTPRAVVPTESPAHALSDKGAESMDVATSDKNSAKEEIVTWAMPLVSTAGNFMTGRPSSSNCPDGFSCVISMHDGVVMYTTSSLTTTLGFPKEMWIGRSFIDFVHPRDRSTFASQITNGLAVPKNVNGTQEKAQSPANSVSTMVCRIRRYRGLTTGFGVKDKAISFMPFLLKLTFKNINDDKGKVIYLVIQATPFFSAFKSPNERVVKAIPFVLRHAANGIIEYIDPESVPYLGFLPQDLTDKDALQLYHPDDLCYLRQVYETIVKEGALPRCRPYRMITQNGNYLKLETEWSSFINPWSKKLEFVIGKHHIIEGPANPDVFQSPVNEKVKVSEEENNKAQMLRENIIRIMNEVLTKPAEVAKQQMSKRCQDLASFMESLMEDQPKTNDELRLDIQDPEHSYYERDSVMLGGISPHHDYNDSKSSTETPLSYNQLNYNETLQRYFDSHQPYSYEDYNTATGENILGLKEPGPLINTGSSHCLSPMAQTSGDSIEFTSSCDSNGQAVCSISPKPYGDYHTLRLTETLLTKHNMEMEKELMKIHRETRSSSRGEREKASNETRQKKKEHLARCNASFQPTSACTTPTKQKPHGVKRASKHTDDSVAHKYHCQSPRQPRRRQRTLSTSGAHAQPSPTITTTIGLYPMYYAPPIPQPLPSMPSSSHHMPSTSNPQQFQIPAMPYMMYGQPFYGTPFMYSSINQHNMMHPMQQTLMAQSMQYTNAMNPLGLTYRNYEEACKPGLPFKPVKLNGTRGDKKRPESQGPSTKLDLGSADSNSSTRALKRSTEAVPDTPMSMNMGKLNRLANSEETTDKTDGESSYSSFYSSFFKTESGSADDSGDAKRGGSSKSLRARSRMHTSNSSFEPRHIKKIAKRKMEPPWMEQVCVTSELIYKYQILTKTMEDVLSADKKKIATLKQPSLVNEQLGQLYLDLHLEGVAAKLTLEEGITSSSSSGEETTTKSTKGPRKKREYNKLVMIYEEDAPLPSPAECNGEEGAYSSSS